MAAITSGENRQYQVKYLFLFFIEVNWFYNSCRFPKKYFTAQKTIEIEFVLRYKQQCYEQS